LRDSKRLLLVIMGALTLLLALISALPRLALQPARSLPGGIQIPDWDLAGHLYTWIILSMIIYTLGFLYLVRRRVTLTLVGLIFLGFFFLFLIWLYREEPLPPQEPPELELVTELTRELEPEEELLPEEIEWDEVEPFTPPPLWVVMLASFGVVLVLLTAVAGLGYYLWFNLRPTDPPLVELGREAQSAVDSLRRGGRLYDVVIRCYHEMSHVLSESRGINRSEVMTPREFENYLAAMGLPQEPISGLTRLFEEVRYGTKESGPLEEERALASLTAIVEACERVS
jgi:hypothetical protein